MSKKGVSTVVGTTLIILLVVVISAGLWYFVNNYTDKGTSSISQDCLTLGVELSKCELHGLCSYTGGLGIYQVDTVVKRNTGSGDLRGLRFVFENVFEKAYIEDKDIIINELESKTYSPGAADGIVVRVFDPIRLGVAVLVGDEKNSCGVNSPYVDCRVIRAYPLSGNPPTTPFNNYCCQFPWNLTTCTVGGTNGVYCCNSVPAGFSTPPLTAGTICNNPVPSYDPLQPSSAANPIPNCCNPLQQHCG